MINFILKKEKKILLLIIFFAFVISLSHSFYFKITPSVDARAYDHIALNLINGYGYVEDPDVSFENDFAIVRVGPGYELFLAGVYYIFGRNLEIVWILQAIFHALSALLAFLIAKKIFKNAKHAIIGLSASALVAFSPDLIISSSMLLTENLGIFLILVSVYFFFDCFDERGTESVFSRRLSLGQFRQISNRRSVAPCLGGATTVKPLPFFLSAIFFGLAALVRSNLILLGVVYAGIFIWRKLYFQSFFFVAIVALMFSPWVVRNYGAYGSFIPFNAALGFNLWTGNHIGASGELDFYEPLYIFARSHASVETHRFGVEKFKEFISAHPIEFVKITLKRLSIYFSFFRPTGFWSYLSKVPKIITISLSLVYGGLIFSLGFSGVWLSLKNSIAGDKTRARWLIFMILSLPLAVAAIVVETRYRYPLYPFLAVFSGFAVYKFITDKKIFLKIFMTAFSIILFNAFIDFLMNSDRVFETLNKLLK
jgi:hypothetical protein